jgi:hypothetical protein
VFGFDYMRVGIDDSKRVGHLFSPLTMSYSER